MTISDTIRMALQKSGKKQVDLAAEWGIPSRAAMNIKFSRGSWSANELANIAEFTGGKLAIIYPDGQQILVIPEGKPTLRGKNKPAEEPADPEEK
jgi:hypothetical protein